MRDSYYWFLMGLGVGAALTFASHEALPACSKVDQVKVVTERVVVLPELNPGDEPYSVSFQISHPKESK